MTVAASAISEVLRVARSILDLGGTATAAEIAAASGLDRTTVVKRLQGGSSIGPHPWWFVCTRRANGTRATRGTSVWGLTPFGAERAKGTA